MAGEGGGGGGGRGWGVRWLGALSYQGSGVGASDTG